MEGPPLKALAEGLSFLENQSIADVWGNTKAGKEGLKGERLNRIYTVGKRLVIEADSLAAVIHFLMFGSYRVDERREGMDPRLSLSLNGHELNFYNCSVKIFSKDQLEGLDAKSDILNPDFARERAMEAAQGHGGIIADLLLDQAIFAGVGNIIKNEALFEATIHPASLSKNIPSEKMKDLLEQTIRFSNAFYEVKRTDRPLKPILKIYQKRICSGCKSRIQRKKMGERKRMTFFCPECQHLF